MLIRLKFIGPIKIRKVGWLGREDFSVGQSGSHLEKKQHKRYEMVEKYPNARRLTAEGVRRSGSYVAATEDVSNAADVRISAAPHHYR
ncbi:hypothetical protein B5V00_02730 [Geothermobacter hydrogeniphilus]|uniref:Uncharacterized protein n=1 Tax=Geothermobacter hydrogeniphilus TaxID=1969733 RepID=A0A1X0YDC8_9BACT|nr:hypothetical protein B5V00_02730 [Geothermobacter hydrogeniphilus]